MSPLAYLIPGRSPASWFGAVVLPVVLLSLYPFWFQLILAVLLVYLTLYCLYITVLMLDACLAILTILLFIKAMIFHVWRYEGEDKMLRELYLRGVLKDAEQSWFPGKAIYMLMSFVMGQTKFKSAFNDPQLMPWLQLDLPGFTVPVEYNVQVDDYGLFHATLTKSHLDYSGCRNFRWEEKQEHGDLEMGEFKSIPILPEQRLSGQPSKWLHLNLVGQNPGDKTTIATRNDNLYLVAFTNKWEEWFVFKDMAHQFPKTVKASWLPFGGGYKDLVGGHANLEGYNVNKKSTLDAVALLARHRQKYSSNDDYNDKLKRALTTLIVVLAEAARFDCIHDTLQDGWRQETTKLSKEHAEVVVTWAPKSRMLLKCAESENETTVSDDKHIDAVRKLKLLLWPRRFRFQ